MNAQVLVGERCHYCSHFRSAEEIYPIGVGGAQICLRCLEWHGKAIGMLAGTPPPGCQECGVTFAQLRERGGDVRMYLHQKDGIYQILCKPCSDAYIPKRRDLYGPTRFGQSLNLVP